MRQFLATLSYFATNMVLPAVIMAVVGIFAIMLIMKLLEATLKKTKLDPQLIRLVLGIIKPVLYLVLGLIIASRLGIDVTSVVALASVLTLAVSLSLQNALSNIFGGFTLLYTKPFTANDFVEIAGQSGTVKEVGLAYTKLITADNKLISIPNASVVSAEIVNYTVLGTRRVDVKISVSYDAKPEDVIAALLAAGEMPLVLADPAPFATVVEYGESSIVYTLRLWTETANYWDVNFHVLNNVKAIFAERGIEMTYPHINVHMLEK